MSASIAADPAHSLAAEATGLLARLGVPPEKLKAGSLEVRSPIDGSLLARLQTHTVADVQAAIERAHRAFLSWREVPAPRRGELVRLLGEELRAHKSELGRLVSLEAGKILQEGLGEVQEMIDICDFAVGLSRQLYGLTIATERPGHAMRESWHPLGAVGIISAFNFPVAVWSWNAALALVAGDSVIWKPSEKTPLTALATQALFERAAERFGTAPDGLSELIVGNRTVGEVLVDDRRVPLVSATGSTQMGRAVGQRLAARFARALLELGGNNGMIVCPSADLDLAVRAILFAAVGTAGQRCTTLRRLFIHQSLYQPLIDRLVRAYDAVSVGNPLEAPTLVGPLIDRDAFERMQQALSDARAEGGTVIGGERLLADRYPDAYYVRPALALMPAQSAVVRRETFAPILYVLSYGELSEAIHLHNDVPQGLSSSIFTTDLREAERFLSATGSDCGIANVNIGPSGAEIGGAFGGEKETGGGRESGSDAWKTYMRRATNTINYSHELPLAQGIQFAIEG
ncbi:aldehyde dehydrogenase family protein [Gloeobacter kilaueensis]|uniref:Aldehyde dehydrogenase n=1 Tax=Gloeobacter kilaueensis (strain ATCC BAA-2537 / CCAP 1431/1 / ULC 316 / JS1) TaxID=1183438 RepID=U5QLM7_GLOK1|nr:aldehyde dehydrogenase family protein [Gloeobacter kilaueensis]AGY58590.1 aldehyde dehydrogenase [Gloeobacter kilaueensis JS1]